MPGNHGVARGGRLAAAIAELYGATPGAFTGRRAELAAAARDAGDREAARAIAALRKPTRAAWVVNQLARADPSAAGKLAGLARALRAAQQAGDGPRLRELSAARGAAIDALTDQALATSSVPDPPPPPLRLEISETLGAALADPEVAAAFAAGTLTRATRWSGFGVPPARETGTRPDRAPPGAASSDGHDHDGDRVDSERVGGRPPASGSGRTRAAPATRGTLPARSGNRAGQAERTARRRERQAEAQRAVAAASGAAAEAVSAEDRLEAEVRDLEQRLTRARSDLAAARMRARRAEAAERRARQALDSAQPNG